MSKYRVFLTNMSMAPLSQDNPGLGQSERHNFENLAAAQARAAAEKDKWTSVFIFEFMAGDWQPIERYHKGHK